MPKPVLAVTFDPSEEARCLLRQTLKDEVEIVYLPPLEKEQRLASIRKAKVLLCRDFSEGEIEEGEWSQFESLQFIQTFYAGVEKIPVTRIPQNVLICCNAGAFSEPVAEQALALMFACAKRIFPQYSLMKQGTFDRTSMNNKFLKGNLCGLVGFGGIGQAVATRAQALQMKVVAVNRSGKTDAPVKLLWLGGMDALDRLLGEADVVVLAVPLTSATRGLIGKRRLDLMKPDAILINVARAPIVLEKDLYEHLVTHPDFHYGSDVWWDETREKGHFKTKFPFLHLPNVVGTPHVGDHVPGMALKALEIAAQNIACFLEGQAVKNRVNLSDYR